MFDIFNTFDFCAGVPPLALRIYFQFKIPECSMGHDYACLALRGFVPVLRLCRLLRRFQQIHLLLAAFKAAFEAMPMLIYMYMCIMLSFAALLYMVEPQFDSIPTAWWLALVTMSTIGYGDMTPATSMGKTSVGLFAFATALYMAVPVGIIGNAFSDVWKDRDKILLMQRAREQLIQAGYGQSDIRTLFGLFDLDGDGVLSMQEFWWMIQGMGVELSKQRAAELYEAIDCDGSGGIDALEFLRALFPGSYVDLIKEDFQQTVDPQTTARLSVVQTALADARDSWQLDGNGVGSLLAGASPPPLPKRSPKVQRAPVRSWSAGSLQSVPEERFEESLEDLRFETMKV